MPDFSQKNQATQDDKTCIKSLQVLSNERKYMETFIIAAQTVDGFIAYDDKQKSTKWTSKEDYLHFIAKTKEAGVIIMGRKTYETIGKPLKDRLNIILTSDPEKYKSRENLIFTNDDPEKILEDLEKKGFKKAAICGGASIYNLFMQKNLVSKIFLTIEPIIFGKGISLFNEKMEKKLKLVKMEKMNERGTVLLEYKIEEN